MMTWLILTRQLMVSTVSITPTFVYILDVIFSPFFLVSFSFIELLPTVFSEMEFPDLGEHCSEKTCKRLGQ